jgi:hypothetical protein
MRLRRSTPAPRAPDLDGSITATIGGTIANSQVAVGNANVQTQTVTTTTVTEAELGELREMFATLKEQVVLADVPAGQRVAALEQVTELEQATLADEPDVMTIRGVARWFAANLPKLAGAVTGVVVHPIVGKLVGAAGDALVAELGMLQAA